jgi:hypothetical protein
VSGVVFSTSGAQFFNSQPEEFWDEGKFYNHSSFASVLKRLNIFFTCVEMGDKSIFCLDGVPEFDQTNKYFWFSYVADRRTTFSTRNA